jgi:hypothetical protein
MWVARGLLLVAVAAAVGCPSAPPPPPNPAPAGQAKPAEAPGLWVRPAKLTAEDWKSALPRDYPDRLRQGMSDEQLARDLDLQAWAFDFAGGPLRCWLELEEAGQATVPPRQPAQGYGEWECDADAGRLVFSVGRGASERMKKIMQKAGKDAFPESAAFTLRFRSTPPGKSGSFGMSHGSSPLWFGWPAEARKFDVQTPAAEGAHEGEPFTLLRVECVEQAPAPKDKPRKAMLLLKGAFGKAKKE